MHLEKYFIVFAVASFGAGCISSTQFIAVPTSSSSTPSSAVAPPTTPATPPLTHDVIAPIDRVLERVTKKPFGLYVTPKNSPVMPEKFVGYHTGVDFETFPTEQERDVTISVICSGPLLLKKWATGYGGVAVQQCKIDGQAMTVVYGHLKLASITNGVGTNIAQGDTLGVLGKGSSTETDGERKHLHLGIHIGTSITILGYVPTESALIGWRDIKKLLSP